MTTNSRCKPKIKLPDVSYALLCTCHCRKLYDVFL